MESLVISKRHDAFVTRLVKQLGEHSFTVRQADSLSSSDAAPPLPPGSVVVVDLRSRENLDNLIKLHFRELHARIICFADQEHLAFERTAATFGGADAFIPTSAGAKAIAEKALAFSKPPSPKGKYKTPLGMQFTAGAFFLNTQEKISLELPVGYRSLTEALRALKSGAKPPSEPFLARPEKLTNLQTLVLEFLKQVRDDETAGKEKYVSSRDITDHVYREKQTRSIASNTMNSLVARLAINPPLRISREDVAHLAGVLYDPEQGYRLNDRYEDLFEPA